MSLEGRPDLQAVTVTKNDYFHRLSCPAWVAKLNIAKLVRFPSISRGRPGSDLAESLLGHLFHGAALRMFGDSQRLVQGAARAWGLVDEAARRKLLRYAQGECMPTLKSRRELALGRTDLEPFVSWPWEALCFRQLNKIPSIRMGELAANEVDVKKAQGKMDQDAMVFWECALRFRRALRTGNAHKMHTKACAMLESLPLVINHPAVRDRKVEFSDLVVRLVYALPTCLFPLPVDVRDILRGALKAPELALVMTTEQELDLSDTIMLNRVAVAMFCRSMGVMRVPTEADFRAWDFLPHVRRQNMQWQS